MARLQPRSACGGCADRGLEPSTWGPLEVPLGPPVRNIGAPSRCICGRANEAPHAWSLGPQRGGDGVWEQCGAARLVSPLPRLSRLGWREPARAGGAGQRVGRGRPPCRQGVGTGLFGCARGQTRTEAAPPGGVWRPGVGGHDEQDSGSLLGSRAPFSPFFHACPWPCPSDNQGVGVVGAHP